MGRVYIHFFLEGGVYSLQCDIIKKGGGCPLLGRSRTLGGVSFPPNIEITQRGVLSRIKLSSLYNINVCDGGEIVKKNCLVFYQILYFADKESKKVQGSCFKENLSKEGEKEQFSQKKTAPISKLYFSSNKIKLNAQKKKH